MTYRELLTLYKTGELDEGTAAEVKAAIEQQDAISEYLFDEGEIPMLDGGEAEELLPAENPEFVKLIQKSIRRAFIKAGAAVCAIVLVGALLAVFVLPRVVDRFYYDPTEVVGVSEQGGMETERMQLDLAVWTELFAPGDYRDQVRATPRGYGNYDLILSSGSSYNWDFKVTGASLVRNRLTLYDPSTLRTPTGNAFVYPGEEEFGVYQSRERSYAAVDELDEDVYYQGFISLDESLPYEAFMEWYGASTENVETHELWCLVDDRTEAGRSGNFQGFSPSAGGYVMDWDRERYPLLSLVGEDVDREDGEAMETHFLSMVRYLKDHPEFSGMLGRSVDSYYGDYLLKAVEENGLRTYGFSVIAPKETFQHFRELEMVNYMYTVPAP